MIKATENDIPKLRDFAEKVGVKWPKVDENTHFFMLEKPELAASCGMTLIEDQAVLRALIINPEHCGLGEAIYLLTAACSEALQLGAKAAYLATTVPSYIFQITGFEKMEHAELPKRLSEYDPFCNREKMGHATIMMKVLKD